MAITFRADKGQALSYSELDTNFGNLYASSSISGSVLKFHFPISNNVPVSESAHEIDFNDFNLPDGDIGAIQYVSQSNKQGGANDYLYESGSGNVGLGGYNLAQISSSAHKLQVSGSIFASGNVLALSDVTMKANINPLGNVTEIISSLTGYSYDKEDSREVGLIAQEVREVLPEAVKEGPDGRLGLNYNSVVSVLLEAVKSLTKRIDNLENNK
jgi:hypothetical protein